MTQSATASNQDGSAGAQVKPEEVLAILARHSGNRAGLIGILDDIQDKYGYLPEQALRTVGKETGRSLVDIYGVATFYRSFSLKPRGKHIISACLGTACHVRGAPRVVEEIERQLGVKPGQTTRDRQFTLETVNCLGACALGPMVVIDGHYFSKVTARKIKGILAQAQAGLCQAETCAEDEWDTSAERQFDGPIGFD